MEKILLNENWSVRRCGCEEVYKTSVPDSIYSILADNKKIPDPYIGMNEKETVSIADGDYEFKRIFKVTSEMMAKDNIDLVFDGLDTVCDVFVNEIKIGSFHDMHVCYRMPVKKYLKEGENILLIRFFSPVDYITKKDKACHVLENVYGMPGFSQIRKAHYMFGWDWGPAVPDIGIWKDVYIESYSSPRLESVYITQEHKQNSVILKFQPEIEGEKDKSKIKVKITSPDGEWIEMCEDNTDSFTYLVENPKLWYPNGYGEQNLYSVEITLVDDGEEVNSKEYTIGLRTIELVNDEDEHGKSFFFRINGLDIFAKGANYIPEHNLLNKRADKREKLLSFAKKSHFNMLRVWGGGIYQDDDFYKRCSEYGILIWQDFMYACACCKFDKELEEDMTAEVITQLRRLRNYPCMALWAGNNEIEDMIGYWRPDEEVLNERRDYVKMFCYLIPSLMEKYHPSGIYKESSPTSDTLFYDMNNPNRGDCHYWEVWHGLKPFAEYRRHLFRFCSEFGFESLPSIETIREFAPENEMNLFSPTMEHHQKFMEGNSKILSYLADNFRYPDSFEDLIYISQIMQAEAIQSGVEHWRSNRGVCMGSLYWQLNDCWPGISWSSVDFYGRWKALQYFANRFYAPLSVTAAEDDGKMFFAVLNDTQKDINATVKWKMVDMEYNTVMSGIYTESVDKLSSKKTDVIEIPERYTSERNKYFVIYELLIDKESIIKRIMLLTENKRYYFKKANINISVQQKKDGVYVSLVSDELARYVRLSANKDTCLFEDNYFDLLPNEEKIIRVESRCDIDEIKNDIKVKCLTDII